MNTRSKKITLCFLVSLLLCGLALVFFRDALFLTGFKWTCGYLSRTCLNGDFQYEKAELEDGFFVFSNIRVHDSHSQQERLAIRKLKLKYALGFNHLDLDVRIDEPQVSLLKNSQSLSRILLEDFLRPLVKLRGQLIISNGSLVLLDQSTSQKVFFEFEAEYRKRVPIHLAMKMGLGSRNENVVELRGRPLTKEVGRQFILQLHQVSCAHLANLVQYFSPKESACEVHEGIADGNLTLSLTKGQDPYVQGEVEVKKLDVSLPQVQINGKFPSVKILFRKSEHIPSQPLKNFFLNVLNNVKGSLSFQEEPLFYYRNEENPWRVACTQSLVEFFPNLETHLKFAGHCCNQRGDFPFNLQGEIEGINQSISLNGHMGGLSGEVKMSWAPSLAKSEGCLKGSLSDCVFLFPHALQEKLHTHFGAEPLAFSFASQSLDKLSGVLKIGQDTIFWGCALSGQQRESKPSQSILNKKLFDDSFPNKVFNTPYCIRMAGIQLEECWFEAKALSLTKFIYPFLLSETPTTLSGIGDFYGHFDDKVVELTYDPYETQLESKHFTMQVKEAHPAQYYFDLVEGSHQGVWSIQQGTYLQKNEGVLFKDIHAQILFENSSIKMRQIETFAEGIFFGGELDVSVDPHKKGAWNIEVRSNLINGKVSQLQQFLSHFIAPSCFLKIPLEGDVCYRQEGGLVKFAVSPQTYEVTAKICGAITDGKMACESDTLRVQDFSLNFAFDTQKKSLSFSDIEGLLIVGPPTQVEEYDLIGDYITFTDYTHNLAAFDLWISDKSRDVLRAVGKTFNQADGTIQVIFDHDLTHFGDVHPQEIKLVLNNNWTQIDALDLTYSFSLKSLLPDLQRLKGIAFLSPLGALCQATRQIKKSAGQFQVSISYDKPNAQYLCNAIGKDLAFDAQCFETCTLNGRKKGNVWIIDQLQLDQISLSADILHRDSYWDLNFLGIRMGEALLAGVEGIYEPGEGIKGKINLLEVDLGLLEKWRLPKEILGPHKLKGKFNAVGNFQAQRIRDLGKWRFETLLSIRAKDLSLNKAAFNNLEEVVCHLVSDKGVRIDNFKLLTKNKNEPAEIHIKKIDVDFIHHSLNIQDLTFLIPVKQLKWVGENLQRLFPASISSRTQELLQKIKRADSIKGKLDLNYSTTDANLHLELAEGPYTFFGKEMLLKDLCFTSNLFEWKMRAQTLEYPHPFWLQANASAPYFDKGEVFISDLPLKQPVDKKQGMRLCWRETALEGFQIDQIEGSLPGLRIHLTRIPSSAAQEIRLQGKILAHLNQVDFLLPDFLYRQVKACGINGQYTLDGNWKFDKKQIAENTQGIQFAGELQGEKCVFKDKLVENLKAGMHYCPAAIELSNLQISDSAGTLEVPVVRIDKKNDDYALSIPLIKVNQFRPSLLRNPQGFSGSPATPFVIKLLEVKNIEGSLLDLRKITGEGRLTFANPKRKTLPNTIFSVPSDAISRIGLDMTLLTPVSGSIYYKIQEGKIVFTRFKDVYSSGKLSKFNLPNTSYQSHVDFEGNLHVQVRLKQYNLLFKLAELFTVSIQGTLQQPTYTLQKQSF